MKTATRIDPHRMTAAEIAHTMIERYGAARALRVIGQRIESAGVANYAQRYRTAEVIIRAALHPDCPTCGGYGEVDDPHHPGRDADPWTPPLMPCPDPFCPGATR